MKQIHRLLRLLIVLFCVCAVPQLANAADTNSGVTFLFTNGQKASFLFTSKPVIAFDNDGLTVSSSGAASVSYTFAEVDRFYFEDNIETGISHAGMERQEMHPVFSYNNGIISIYGLKYGESVSVYSIGGSKVCTANAGPDGTANADISNVVSGVYVVGTGSGVSFKLLKK